MEIDIENQREKARAAEKARLGPQQLGHLQIGDAVRLPGLTETYEVIAFADNALAMLRAPSGRVFKAGWKCCRKVNQRGSRNEQ